MSVAGIAVVIAGAIWSSARVFVRLVEGEVVVQNAFREYRFSISSIESIEWVRATTSGLEQLRVGLSSGQSVRIDASVR